MNVIMEKEKGKYPEKKITPAALLYYQMKDPLVEKAFDDETIQENILKELRPNGLVNASPDVVAHLDRELDKQSNVIPVTKNKDGSFSKQSSVLPEEEFFLLTKYADGKARELGNEILKGNVEIAPYELDKHTGCDYCPYRGICGFDEKIPGYKYRKLGKESKTEVINKIAEEVQRWE